MDNTQPKVKHFLSEARITFTGETVENESGHPTVDTLAKALASFVSAVKTTYPGVKITPVLETTYSDEPIEVEVTTKKL